MNLPDVLAAAGEVHSVQRASTLELGAEPDAGLALPKIQSSLPRDLDWSDLLSTIISHSGKLACRFEAFHRFPAGVIFRLQLFFQLELIRTHHESIMDELTVIKKRRTEVRLSNSF